MGFWTFLISMMPVGELRFSIPFGIFSGLHWSEAFIYSFIGNSLITLVIIYLIDYYKMDNITNIIARIPLIGVIFKKMAKTEQLKKVKSLIIGHILD